ncbi:hypothetical protein PVAP13_5KG590214 [Panicum virgatum]|uniref:Uncharacterized protein n=1 Tax=Panicum virgatum TaxID=38727 RepID=A0A8T0SX14_PANVG|nr:hypothetical protein PVAP13_5KG590214 [Panicum virgatum]
MISPSRVARANSIPPIFLRSQQKILLIMSSSTRWVQRCPTWTLLCILTLSVIYRPI